MKKELRGLINEKEILKELDERIAIQNRNIEREIATYLSVKKLIKEKCTP